MAPGLDGGCSRSCPCMRPTRDSSCAGESLVAASLDGARSPSEPSPRAWCRARGRIPRIRLGDRLGPLHRPGDPLAKHGDGDGRCMRALRPDSGPGKTCRADARMGRGGDHDNRALGARDLSRIRPSLLYVHELFRLQLLLDGASLRAGQHACVAVLQSGQRTGDRPNEDQGGRASRRVFDDDPELAAHGGILAKPLASEPATGFRSE